MKFRLPGSLTLVVAAMVCATLGGCGSKLNDVFDEKGVKPGGDVRVFSYGEFPNDYVATVEFRSTAAEVTVGVFRQSDVPDPARLDESKAIAQKTGKEGTVKADIPKGTPIRVLIYNAKVPTDVWVKTTSKSK